MGESVEVTQVCPGCGRSVTMVPYDIGSGPELACPGCEWCWGADGQPLRPAALPVCPGCGHTGVHVPGVGCGDVAAGSGRCGCQARLDVLL